MAVAAREVRRTSVFRVVAGLAVAGWALAVAASLTGRGTALSHDALIHSTLPLWAALVASLVAWQVMFAAMMVPTTAPLARRVAAEGWRPAAGFLGAYALVWTAFGAAAFLGDALLHRVVHGVPWLLDHRWVVAGAVLGAAGAFQFTRTKRACLATCRDPQRHVRGRDGRGFRVGLSYGLSCLGDCWALMLVMFAAGMANLWWMIALTVVMAYEKIGREFDLASKLAGVALLALAALVLVHPAWIAGVLSAG
jgi:predicted metal-binding membrane protein